MQAASRTRAPVDCFAIVAMRIVWSMKRGELAPPRQNTRLFSSKQSLKSLTALNSGKTASVHEVETPLNVSYTGLAASTAEVKAGGTSSTPRMSASSSSVWSRIPKQPLANVSRPAAPARTAAVDAAAPAGSRDSDMTSWPARPAAASLPHVDGAIATAQGSIRKKAVADMPRFVRGAGHAAKPANV